MIALLISVAPLLIRAIPLPSGARLPEITLFFSVAVAVTTYTPPPASLPR